MSKKVTIVDYKCGNIFSLKNILNKFDYDTEITDDPDKISSASKVILPGVGAFPIGIQNLKKNNIDESLKDFLSKGKYLLGICLGMQLLLSKSDEFGENNGLDLIKGRVTKLDPSNEKIKVPHIGWSKAKIISNKSNLSENFFQNLKDNSYFYFIHSFKVETNNFSDTWAFTNYGANKFSSVIGKENIIGCQFHPEKSGFNGEKLIKNFLSL